MPIFRMNVVCRLSLMTPNCSPNLFPPLGGVSVVAYTNERGANRMVSNKSQQLCPDTHYSEITPSLLAH